MPSFGFVTVMLLHYIATGRVKWRCYENNTADEHDYKSRNLLWITLLSMHEFFTLKIHTIYLLSACFEFLLSVKMDKVMI